MMSSDSISKALGWSRMRTHIPYLDNILIIENHSSATHSHRSKVWVTGIQFLVKISFHKCNYFCGKSCNLKFALATSSSGDLK